MILDLFAGAGGATCGLLDAASEPIIGIEHDAQAVDTSRTNGHRMIHADIRHVNPHDFGLVTHIHASPPCTTFSAAGTGKGRQHLHALAVAVTDVLRGLSPQQAAPDADEITLLVLEPARWIRELRPETISMEQVRSVLPVWEA